MKVGDAGKILEREICCKLEEFYNQSKNKTKVISLSPEK
jgi:hypothetical protein